MPDATSSSLESHYMDDLLVRNQDDSLLVTRAAMPAGHMWCSTVSNLSLVPSATDNLAVNFQWWEDQAAAGAQPVPPQCVVHATNAVRSPAELCATGSLPGLDQARVQNTNP